MVVGDRHDHDFIRRVLRGQRRQLIANHIRRAEDGAATFGDCGEALWMAIEKIERHLGWRNGNRRAGQEMRECHS